jgi:hypothetical protein
VEELLRFNFLKDSYEGYTLANPFITRLFYVFYRSQKMIHFTPIFDQYKKLDFLDLLCSTIPHMNAMMLARGSRVTKTGVSDQSIPKLKEEVFVSEFKSTLEVLLENYQVTYVFYY